MSDFPPEPVVLQRHRGLLAITIAIALVMASTFDRSLLLGAVAFATVIPALLTGLSPRATSKWLAASMGTTLIAQAALATAVFGEEAYSGELLVTALAIVATYRARGVLIATGGAVAVGQVLRITLGPHYLEAHEWQHADGLASLGIVGTAAALATWALATLWRDHREAIRLADEHDQIAAAYREVMPLVAIHLDRDGNLIDANRKTCMMLDREIEDIVGQNWFDIAVAPEYREQGREYYAAGYEPGYDLIGSVGSSYVNEIVAADGHRRLVEWSADYILDDHNERISMLCVGRDVTDELAAKADAARSRAEIDALRRLAQKIASLDDARQAVADATLELCGAVSVVIAEPDRQRERLTIHTATDERFVGTTIEMAKESSNIGQAFLSGRTIVLDDVQQSASSHAKLAQLTGPLAAVHQPIVGAHGVMGVISVGWREPLGDGKEHALELVRLVAHEAAVALRRRESIDALERAALVDPLTSVSNRRAFDAELPAALRRAADSGQPFALVVMDLNHFKPVNDELGHEAGDKLLIDCASSWSNVLRAGDLLARLGGDEFAVLLPACDEIEMAQVIARLRGATPHRPGTAIGGAVWDGVESGSQFVRRADDAQYRDKAAGRQRQAETSPRSAIEARPGRPDPRL